MASASPVIRHPATALRRDHPPSPTVHRPARDAKAALADYNQAIFLNPMYVAAYIGRSMIKREFPPRDLDGAWVALPLPLLPTPSPIPSPTPTPASYPKPHP